MSRTPYPDWRKRDDAQERHEGIAIAMASIAIAGAIMGSIWTYVAAIPKPAPLRAPVSVEGTFKFDERFWVLDANGNGAN